MFILSHYALKYNSKNFSVKLLTTAAGCGIITTLLNALTKLSPRECFKRADGRCESVAETDDALPSEQSSPKGFLVRSYGCPVIMADGFLEPKSDRTLR